MMKYIKLFENFQGGEAEFYIFKGDVPSQDNQPNFMMRPVAPQYIEGEAAKVKVRRVPIPLKTNEVEGEFPVIYLEERAIIVYEINDKIRVPFYCSTGSGNKKNVPSGRWYPFFGYDDWFNKTTEDEINNYYGSKILKYICGKLDTKVGDLRPIDGEPAKYRGRDIPECWWHNSDNRHIDFINRDMQPVLNMPRLTQTLIDKINRVKRDIANTLIWKNYISASGIPIR